MFIRTLISYICRMNIDVPTPAMLAELAKHRHSPSASLYVPSAPAAGEGRAPLAFDTDAARTALRSLTGRVREELAALGAPAEAVEALLSALKSLEQDREFWSSRARTVAVFASPDGLRAFRLMNELPAHASVGDRFDLGPLLRAATFPHDGYALAVTAGEARLIALESDSSHHAVPLDLPEDAGEQILSPTIESGRFDRRGADGALGPKREQTRYCAVVQEAALAQIAALGDRPLVLTASDDLATAYREVNSYPGLLADGIDGNPSSWSDEEIAARAREILERHYAARIADWRERFGDLRARNQASAQLSDVASAVAAGLVDTLCYDLEDRQEGAIDEFGITALAAEPGPETYAIVDELAARVLRTGGTVYAVRRDELPEDSPVAATFRAAR